MSLRLGRDRPAQALPRRSKVELGVQSPGGPVAHLLCLSCGAHLCMLRPGPAEVLGLWLQGLERQVQTDGATSFLPLPFPEPISGHLGSFSTRGAMVLQLMGIRGPMLPPGACPMRQLGGSQYSLSFWQPGLWEGKSLPISHGKL